MTEREKMLSGLLYDPSDPELSRQRDVARNMAAAFNRTTEKRNKTAGDFEGAFGLDG